ncbi:divergent polysaccharide deacetylase family protein [Thalassotalea castellviae]|uniref:Divergent polysaccharide deacetylase family protein n=1 Tax=Thalassotalea castellviae TaxID=3075612 RepID=A0ABU3A0T3_9GAMM|nr:divergent polysaccharide deacetylase family protein [Thalassotalea sp. W431]MDT0603787.1 divergent polysaccharide deacetylase family protein [Thalassotalea sp. W431]
MKKLTCYSEHKKTIVILIVRYIFPLLLLLFTNVAFAQQAKVAIIIDDIGYRKTDNASLNLPGAVTYAILPHTPFGKKLAELANAKHKDVILHIPMEAENGKTLGPGALTVEMDEASIRSSLADSFAEIPFAIGINNHMGSKLTKLYSPMAWTMRFLKDNGLIFIDSVTTENSKARKLARHFGVPNLSRHLFLDNELSQAYISGQFAQLINQAKKYKRVVAIAHPHPETMTALQYLIPQLAEHDIQLVGISKLLPQFSADNKQLISE